jgi:hypothetical protein
MSARARGADVTGALVAVVGAVSCGVRVGAIAALAQVVRAWVVIVAVARDFAFRLGLGRPGIERFVDGRRWGPARIGILRAGDDGSVRQWLVVLLVARVVWGGAASGRGARSVRGIAIWSSLRRAGGARCAC